MRRTQITEGFYWIDRLHFGLTVGQVKRDNEGCYFVVFPGLAPRYAIGTPDAAYPTSIETKRFKERIPEWTKPERRGKESWE